MADRQPSSPQASSLSESQTSYLQQRSRRQLALFAAGAGFFALSSVITRRSIVRRYKAIVPKFYTPSNIPPEVNGAVEALEALSLATINVLSAGIMLTGGMLYAFDISSLDDIRRYVLIKVGANGSQTDRDAEKELEKWVSSVMQAASTVDKEGDDSQKPKDREATILEMVSKLQEGQAKGTLDKEGIVSILDRISKLEEERKQDEERKS